MKLSIQLLVFCPCETTQGGAEPAARNRVAGAGAVAAAARSTVTAVHRGEGRRTVLAMLEDLRPWQLEEMLV